MSSFIYEPTRLLPTDPLWILKYCLSLMSCNDRFPRNLQYLMEDGSMEGQIDWAIHRWTDETELEYPDLKPFEGYRAYLGPEEHARKDIQGDLEVYIDEKTLKEHLAIVCDWYVQQRPEFKDEIADLRKKYGI